MDRQTLSRHVLYGCGACVALVLAPQLSRIPAWETAIVLLVLIWKLFTVSRGQMPPRLAMAAVSMIVAGGVLATYGTFVGRTAGTALLLAMLAMKYLETRSVRDATLVVYLAYFVIVTNFLFGQSLLMAGYLLVSVVVCTLTLLTLHTRAPAPALAARTRLSVRLVLEALPIALVLFVLFPRIPGPLWGLPEDRHSGITGLSETMSPGSISSLSRSARVVFRARFDGPTPRHEQLYWRGPVLWQYDGRTWTGARLPPTDALSLQVTGRPAYYTLTMEPHGRRWIYALDLPGQLAPATALTPDLQLLNEHALVSVKRFQLVSYTDYRVVEPMTPHLRALALQLPQGRNPGTVALGASLAERAIDASDIVARALDYYRERPFVYTLSPPLLGEDAMDEFLFTVRRGFCESFASSFVVLMRAAGVPARIVTGYQGGELNALGEDYVLVRQADAHAWAEVWLDGSGWTRIDPTATVAPARIETGIDSALEDDSALPLLMRSEARLLRRAALLWDSFSNGWNEWVLGYGPKLQRKFLGGLGFGGYNALKAGIALVVIVGLLLLAVALAPALRARAANPVARSYARFCRKLARAGLPRAPHEGPLDFTRRATAAFPAQAEQIRRISDLYVALFYGGRRMPAGAGQLTRMTRALRLPRAPAESTSP